MTEKQALIQKLNHLRSKVDGLPPLREEKIAKMSIGVVQANIDAYERASDQLVSMTAKNCNWMA
jgi:hypothetical protein